MTWHRKPSARPKPVEYDATIEHLQTQTRSVVKRLRAAIDDLEVAIHESTYPADEKEDDGA